MSSGIILIMNIANAFAEVSYRTVRVDDLDIFYREAGPKEGPTILLLHGLPSSSRMYQPLLESDLASQYHRNVNSGLGVNTMDFGQPGLASIGYYNS